MKQFILGVFILFFLYGKSQSYELALNSKDTINFIDKIGKKQGKWILLGKHKPGQCYSPNQKAEEGSYKENRKTGNWLEYYCNGNTKNNLTFVNGRPDGYALMYYENGNKKEEGDWKNNKWVGNYKLYYENGQVQHEFKFNEGGKREGVQTYKYENGQVAIEGNFVNGKESGQIKEFHETGDIKAVKNYNNGDVDVNSIKTYEASAGKKIVKTNDTQIASANKAFSEVKKEESTLDSKVTAMVLNGKHILYNKNKQISKDGDFKENRLMEGKAFIYNENGILTRVALYKNGIYIGDGNIEN